MEEDEDDEMDEGEEGYGDTPDGFSESTGEEAPESDDEASTQSSATPGP